MILIELKLRYLLSVGPPVYLLLFDLCVSVKYENGVDEKLKEKRLQNRIY